jgi:hypothetical protein
MKYWEEFVQGLMMRGSDELGKFITDFKLSK